MTTWWQRARRAGAVLGLGLGLMGQPLAGAAAWERLQLDLRGEIQVKEQSSDPAQPVVTVRRHDELLLDRDGRFRLRTESHYPGPVVFRFMEVGAFGAGSVTVDLLKWRNGTQMARKNARELAPDLAELRFLVPALLQPQVAAAAPAVLEVEDLAGRRVELTRDAATGDVLSARSASGAVYEYARYETLPSGLRQPRQIVEKRNDAVRVRWQVTATELDGRDVHAFEPPEGYVDLPPDAQGMRAVLVGPGSYRVDGSASGYHSSFSIGSQGIVVYDAPVSPDEARKVRALIESLAPGRLVTHVVVSHAHRDHVSGLPVYAAEGAAILAGHDARLALGRQHGAELAAHVSEVSEVRELDLGDRRIRLMPVQSSHASDMLVAYDSGSRALFQGDMFYIPDLGPVPAAFPMAAELQALIRREKLDVAWIVGVHGRSGTPAELGEGLRLAHLPSPR